MSSYLPSFALTATLNFRFVPRSFPAILSPMPTIAQHIKKNPSTFAIYSGNKVLVMTQRLNHSTIRVHSHREYDNAKVNNFLTYLKRKVPMVCNSKKHWDAIKRQFIHFGLNWNVIVIMKSVTLFNFQINIENLRISQKCRNIYKKLVFCHKCTTVVFLCPL